MTEKAREAITEPTEPFEWRAAYRSPWEADGLRLVMATLGATPIGGAPEPPGDSPTQGGGTMSTEDLKNRITELLAEPPEDDAEVRFIRVWELYDLLYGPPNHKSPPRPGDDAPYRAVDRVLEDLIRDGAVGKSYTYDEIVPGSDCIGRVYYVWLRTPATAAIDRRMRELDLLWAMTTGGMFSDDPALLASATDEELERVRDEPERIIARAADEG